MFSRKKKFQDMRMLFKYFEGDNVCDNWSMSQLSRYLVHSIITISYTRNLTRNVDKNFFSQGQTSEEISKSMFRVISSDRI